MTNEELVERIASGDETALESLCLNNIGLIRNRAMRIAQRYGCIHRTTSGTYTEWTSETLSDLESVGMLTLIECVRAGDYDTLAAAPLIGRMVESSLKEVNKGVIEAAVSMGAKTKTIVFKVLIGEARTSLLVGVTIVLGTVLGYSAMAGVVGGSGLGDIAIRYGYYRYDTPVMLVTLVFIVAIVQLMQVVGTLLTKRMDHRNNE